MIISLAEFKIDFCSTEHTEAEVYAAASMLADHLCEECDTIKEVYSAASMIYSDPPSDFDYYLETAIERLVTQRSVDAIDSSERVVVEGSHSDRRGTRRCSDSSRSIGVGVSGIRSTNIDGGYVPCT